MPLRSSSNCHCIPPCRRPLGLLQSPAAEVLHFPSLGWQSFMSRQARNMNMLTLLGLQSPINSSRQTSRAGLGSLRYQFWKVLFSINLLGDPVGLTTSVTGACGLFWGLGLLFWGLGWMLGCSRLPISMPQRRLKRGYSGRNLPKVKAPSNLPPPAQAES